MPQPQSPSVKEKLRIGLKVHEAFSLWLAEELVPVVLVDDMSGQSVADTDYPRDAVGRINRAAGGAGTNVECIVTGVPRVVVLVESVLVSKPTAGNIQIRRDRNTVIAAATTQKTFRDLRPGATPNLLMGASVPLTAAIDGDFVMSIGVAAVESALIPLGFILGEGDSLLAISETANEALTAIYYWREYLVEDI